MPFDSLARFGKGKKIECKEDPIIDVPNVLSSLIKRRKSVRKYQDKDVPNELLEKILDSARYTPSAGNYQPWEFIIVRNQSLKSDLTEGCYDQKWMLSAPVFIVACINSRLAGAVYKERGLRLYGIQAVAAAIQNMLLTAESLGLGTCWVGAFSEIIVSRVLQCPEYARPCAIITLGYSCDESIKAPRQDMKEYVHYEVFGETLQQKEVNEEKSPTYMKFQ
jgi:nitroreductase